MRHGSVPLVPLKGGMPLSVHSRSGDLKNSDCNGDSLCGDLPVDTELCSTWQSVTFAGSLLMHFVRRFPILRTRNVLKLDSSWRARRKRVLIFAIGPTLLHSNILLISITMFRYVLLCSKISYALG